MEPITDEQRGESFDYYLRRAIFFGERHEVSCIGLNGQTWNALHVVAREFPNVTYESVLLARSAFETPIDWDTLVKRYSQDLPAVDLTTRQRKNTRQRP